MVGFFSCEAGIRITPYLNDYGFIPARKWLTSEHCSGKLKRDSVVELITWFIVACSMEFESVAAL